MPVCLLDLKLHSTLPNRHFFGVVLYTTNTFPSPSLLRITNGAEMRSTFAKQRGVGWRSIGLVYQIFHPNAKLQVDINV